MIALTTLKNSRPLPADLQAAPRTSSLATELLEIRSTSANGTRRGETAGGNKMKLAVIAMFLMGAIGTATAQTPPPASSSSTKGLTEAQARYAADAAGYAPASDMTQDKNGDWMGGNATKGNFMVDPNGKVTAR
jgi:hypothetical protein